MPNDAQQPQRRRFFSEGLARAIAPLADYLDRIVPSLSMPWPLRPPGALPGDAFLDACQRCGKCIEVCPVHAVRWFMRPGDPAHRTPIVNPNIAACVACDGLKCTHACPSGALQPLTDRNHIRMGLAVVHPRRCVRRHGDDCSACVDLCPYGEAAIVLIDDGPPEVRSGCVGCGVCQQHCPTKPKAIVIQSPNPPT